MKNSQRIIKNSRNALNLSRKSSVRSAKLPDRADLLSLHLPLECSLASRQQFHSLPQLSAVLQPACVKHAGLIGDAPCPSEYVLGNAFDKFCRSAFPLMKLVGGYFLLFHCFHSWFSRSRECNWSIFEECILFYDSDQNAKGRFFKFPFPLSKNQGMAFAESGCFHSSLPKTQEWFLAKQSFSTPARQNPGNGFHPNNLFPTSVPNIGPPRLSRQRWPAGRCPCAGPGGRKKAAPGR